MCSKIHLPLPALTAGPIKVIVHLGLLYFLACPCQEQPSIPDKPSKIFENVSSLKESDLSFTYQTITSKQKAKYLVVFFIQHRNKEILRNSDVDGHQIGIEDTYRSMYHPPRTFHGRRGKVSLVGVCLHCPQIGLVFIFRRLLRIQIPLSCCCA